MSKTIFGFVGQIGCGKGMASAYLEKQHGASTYRFSTMLRDVLDRLYIEQNRQNIQTISTVIREHFGEDTMARVMAKDVEQDPHAFLVVDGIRRPDDIIYLGTIPGFILIAIEADMHVRYRRITNRGENIDDAIKTFEQFEQDHLGEPEQKISAVMRQSTEVIDNNGSVEQLYSQLDQLVKKYAYSN